ncbi:MAG: indole-3-glycerol phosphate synthase TrpC [Firmicutes bacterium]|jgi:indole-3-glycerol phosphate synthase|nr:indole-3-glycerol phosphate synthase TrpC [Bacillota bacterium]
MMYLEPILRHKRQEIEERKRRLPLPALMSGLQKDADPAGGGERFRQALHSHHPVALIAEVKKASPSKGVICEDFDPEKIAASYERAGAAAISVLTDHRFFGGSLEYLHGIARQVGLPVLYKDFVIDPYQLYEAKIAGASAVLLIVAALVKEELLDLLALAHALDMAALVEVHTEHELDTALTAGAQIIGINNRDLTTFVTSLNTTERLAPYVPKTCTLVSESGIKTHEDLLYLAGLGVHAVLVGEALMRQADKEAAVRRLLGREEIDHAR